MQIHVAALVFTVFIINTAQSSDVIAAYILIRQLFEVSNYVYADKVEAVSTGCQTQSVFTREENCLRALNSSLVTQGTSVGMFMTSDPRILLQSFCRYPMPSLVFVDCMFDTFRNCVNSELRGLLPDHSRTNDAFTYMCNNSANLNCEQPTSSKTRTCIVQEAQNVQANVLSSCSSISAVQSCYRNNMDCTPQFIQTFSTFVEKLKPEACRPASTSETGSLAGRPDVSGTLMVAWTLAVWAFLVAPKRTL